MFVLLKSGCAGEDSVAYLNITTLENVFQIYIA